MLTKDLRRGDRRWRSYCVWMRRLKNDWATHGWQYSIRPVFDWSGPDPKKVVGWTNDLCRCFDLKNKEALRFKDTPTGNESQAAFRRNDGYHDQEIWEERNAEGDEARPVKERRDRRKGTHPFRVRCNCGFLLEIIEVENGSWYRRDWTRRCEDCQRKENERRATVEKAMLKMPA